jgi:methyl-accepting chemotaxis protein
MTIKSKLYLTLVIPVLALIIFSVSALIRNFDEYSNMRLVSNYVQTSAMISKLVHEIQKERGMVSGFIGSKGVEFAGEIRGQRANVDNALSEFERFIEADSAIAGELRSQIMQAVTSAEKMGQMRGRVDALSVTSEDAIVFYSRINDEFLSAIAGMSGASENAAISKDLTAYMNFLFSKERAGIERAVLTNVFASDSFGEGVYNEFNRLVTEQDTYLTVFEHSASDEIKSIYRGAANDPSFAKVREFRQTAVTNAQTGGFGVNPSEWFKTASAKINALKGADDKMSGGIIAMADGYLSSAKTAMTVNVFASVLSLISLVLLLYVIRFNVISSIYRLIRLTKNLNSGDADLTQRINTGSRDEMAELAGNINDFIASIESIVTEVKGISGSLASSSAEFAATAEELSVTFADQTGQANDMASAMEEMNVTSRSINENTTDANALTVQAFDLTREGSAELLNAVAKVNGIKKTTDGLSQIISKLIVSSDEIGAIVGAISDIADQTNLLALNAAIEAARAGDAGRGFAVVADEVRKLAEKTQESTKTITNIINTLANESRLAGESMTEARHSVEEGVEVIEVTTGIFRRIEDSVSKVREANDFVTVSISEQAQAIDASSENIRQVFRGISESNTAVEQITFTVNDLENQAVNLNSMMQRFKTS